MNARMPDLERAFEATGFTEVKTLLSSGNVVFSAPGSSVASIQKKAEAAMQKQLGKAFLTIVRPIDSLREMLASDPYAKYRLEPASKRIVTFLLAAPKAAPKLPIELDGARILTVKGTEVFSAYLPTAKGPVFMALIQKTFGREQTTRTWRTVEKVAR